MVNEDVIVVDDNEHGDLDIDLTCIIAFVATSEQPRFDSFRVACGHECFSTCAECSSIAEPILLDIAYSIHIVTHMSDALDT